MTPTFFQIRLILTLALISAGGILSGCLATNAPDTKFYVLTPLGNAAALDAGSGSSGRLSVEVVSLRLPQYLERPQIVTRSSGNRLELAEFHQWGGNLGKDMARVLAKNLSRLLGTPNIAMAPHRPLAPPDFRIDLEVMQFEKDYNGRVVLSVQWRLSRGSDQRLLEARITDLASPAAIAEKDYERTVAAMSELFGELGKIIGEAILKAHGQAK
ncbi:MAG: membrane integrity-associated transporter subunit PqiC [Nitrospinae bacterium]|nr:membrane integrity-associated transporter subunit PqiC [Nitrospinota bacterium]